jgi:transcriptional antiterminator NusG
MEQAVNKWYILNVVAGQENKVASEIKSMIMRGVFGGSVIDAVVPTKPAVKIKKGQKVQEMQKLFPGYVFINANLASEAYNTINAIPKVMGFLGGKNNPQPVADAKMEDILKLSTEQASDQRAVAFEIGETLTVTEGPFESFTGVVEDFDVEKQKVKISVLIFGRATSVELDISQVEKGVK